MTFFLVSFTSCSLCICNSHFSDNSMAKGRVAGIFEKTIFIITVIGTESSIPTTHQRLHQNHKAIMITKGLRLSLFHINFGSIMFHIRTCVQTNHEAINKTG